MRFHTWPFLIGRGLFLLFFCFFFLGFFGSQVVQLNKRFPYFFVSVGNVDVVHSQKHNRKKQDGDDQRFMFLKKIHFIYSSRARYSFTKESRSWAVLTV